MERQDANAKEELQRRLRRIEGQVRGVQRMLEDERDCREVMQQLAAIRAAVHGAGLLVMRQYASECLSRVDLEDAAARESLVADLVGLLGRTQ